MLLRKTKLVEPRPGTKVCNFDFNAQLRSFRFRPVKAVEFGVVCHTGATAGVSVFQATPGLSASDPSLGRRVAPWSTTAGLAAGAACILPPGELLALHGPYRRSEHQMEPGIAALNADLRSHTECAAAVAALGDDGAFWEMEALGTLENVVCHRAQDARLHV